MPVSFVLINSEHGSDESVIEALKGALSGEEGVEYEMQGVYGVYDIVLRLSSDDAARLRSIITNKVRRIGRVQSTLTMMVIEEQGS
ncbi:MAG: Lrp/AsnC ligand binding domain-containing protein [Thaumarchaeota archaeon]|nr:Lrp/AsnC ligand binding domain-containing protein [Nitrososphaerota archaeon]RNJ71315.1 MAG: Lrp/AsnC family transcriptional regulator [Thaumarchaeota archaeon S14]RNJ73474.1 MAG: Lrp/AsnC family transcriptional regulator [Thaumarchaeota archaeon S15]MDD9808450.1 Lrp/AsnC ligand binding domain-containing protein [Nitrososphaerota archaeon]MDD9814091.1 Lrp/AsnC ligand binding domain-containing protein [Nitrososphaerota archaeon]